MENIFHRVYIGKKLSYSFLESIWYDTASHAQACIRDLKEIRRKVPDVSIVSQGIEYKIDSDSIYLDWVKNVFSPNSTVYLADFSQDL